MKSNQLQEIIKPPPSLPSKFKQDWRLAFGIGYYPPAEMRPRWQAALKALAEKHEKET